ncbi:hypothetical protein D3C71_1101370 [compost metagenome]
MGFTVNQGVERALGQIGAGMLVLSDGTELKLISSIYVAMGVRSPVQNHVSFRSERIIEEVRESCNFHPLLQGARDAVHVRIGPDHDDVLAACGCGIVQRNAGDLVGAALKARIRSKFGRFILKACQKRVNLPIQLFLRNIGAALQPAVQISGNIGDHFVNLLLREMQALHIILPRLGPLRSA